MDLLSWPEILMKIQEWRWSIHYHNNCYSQDEDGHENLKQVLSVQIHLSLVTSFVLYVCTRTRWRVLFEWMSLFEICYPLKVAIVADYETQPIRYTFSKVFKKRYNLGKTPSKYQDNVSSGFSLIEVSRLSVSVPLLLTFDASST